jgi:hypothetical protein
LFEKSICEYFLNSALNYITVVNYGKKMKVNSLTATFTYVPQKPMGWSGNVSATKSFIDERARNILIIPDFVFNGNLNFDFGYGTNFMYPGNKTLKNIFEGFNMGVFYQNRSGTFLNKPLLSGYNHEYTPNFSFFNLRAEKGFYFRKTGFYVSAYIWVENLFNKQNLYYINPNTGKPNDNGYLSDPNWQHEIENKLDPESFRTLYQMRLNDPAYYAKPRIWRLGIIAKF